MKCLVREAALVLAQQCADSHPSASSALTNATSLVCCHILLGEEAQGEFKNLPLYFLGYFGLALPSAPANISNIQG